MLPEPPALLDGRIRLLSDELKVMVTDICCHARRSILSEIRSNSTSAAIARKGRKPKRPDNVDTLLQDRFDAVIKLISQEIDRRVEDL
jgi:hypothetical protein